MRVLPPGSILQNLYLKERVRKSNWKNFIEIGSGNGFLSSILLQKGLFGKGFDLNSSACENNRLLNNIYICQGKYEVLNKDFMMHELNEKYDLIIASMVIEHLSDEELDKLILKCKTLLSMNGALVFFVPSSMKYWGIEDEIAGHMKRYEFVDFSILAEKYGFNIQDIAGLTYPISNWTLSLSNMIVSKHESKILDMSQKDKTVYTGNRNIPYKTNFPAILGLVLNEWVLYPFHILQKVFKRSPDSLVIYCELINK